MSAHNHHGTLVVVGEKGVLITGPSGSGKSMLALKLLASGKEAGLFARLVSDDQVLLSACSGRVIGTAPTPIAGLIEVRGVGPAAVLYEKAAVVDLVIRLVPQGEAPRMNDDTTVVLEGIPIAVLELEARNAEGAAFAILAKLQLGLFAGH